MTDAERQAEQLTRTFVDARTRLHKLAVADSVVGNSFYTPPSISFKPRPPSTVLDRLSSWFSDQSPATRKGIGGAAIGALAGGLLPEFMGGDEEQSPSIGRRLRRMLGNAAVGAIAGGGLGAGVGKYLEPEVRPGFQPTGDGRPSADMTEAEAEAIDAAANAGPVRKGFTNAIRQVNNAAGIKEPKTMTEATLHGGLFGLGSGLATRMGVLPLIDKLDKTLLQGRTIPGWVPLPRGLKRMLTNSGTPTFPTVGTGDKATTVPLKIMHTAKNKVTGKPVKSDVIDNKATAAIQNLLETPEIREFLRSGSPTEGPAFRKARQRVVDELARSTEGTLSAQERRALAVEALAHVRPGERPTHRIVGGKPNLWSAILGLGVGAYGTDLNARYVQNVRDGLPIVGNGGGQP